MARSTDWMPPLRWLLRAPGLVYRANLGWLLGERFVQLTVRGRRSGLPRRVVLEVIGRGSSRAELLVASAWGRQAEWFRNVQADPRVQVQVGRRRFVSEVSEISESAAAEALRDYARAHRLAYRGFIGPLLLGHRPLCTPEEFTALARTLPILLVRPAASRGC